jgi:hypothetical protein
MESYNTTKNPKSSNDRTWVLFRRGWNIKRLWILSIIGVTGLALDASFHTIQSGTPLTIIFDGADFSTGKMVLKTSYEVSLLSWSGHITFLTAFGLLTVLPWLFFEKETGKDGTGHRTWAILKEQRTVKQLWLIALIGVAGMALDVSFHWLQDGDPSKVVLNGFEDPNRAVSALALSAHAMFLVAFSMLIFLPKILFAQTHKADYNKSKEYFMPIFHSIA